jgi:hypothetical protein
MAKLNSNMLVKGARGHVGKQFVYKQQANQTVIAKMPEVKKNLIPSQEQQAVRDLFAAAVVYAKGAMGDPLLKSEYQKKANAVRTAYNIAFRDYLKAPVVTGINAEAYDGTVGSLITVSAKDDFRVTEVRVSVYDANGNLVEQGNALLHPIDRNKWSYNSTVAQADIAGSIITAEAMDIPGNKGSLQIIL